MTCFALGRSLVLSGLVIGYVPQILAGTFDGVDLLGSVAGLRVAVYFASCEASPPRTVTEADSTGQFRLT